MNNNTPYALLISIAALLMVGISYFFGGGASDTQVLAQLNAVKAQLAESQHAGALSGPEIQSPYIQWGNVNHWAAGPGLSAATGTVCAIQSPAATTTLVSATLRIDNAAAYATGPWQIGKSNLIGATTTLLASLNSIAASQPANLIATSTTGTLTDNVVAPNSWINFNVATGSPSASFAPAGKCAVTFREI